MSDLEILADWCEEYRGDVEREGMTVMCRFGMGTFVKMTDKRGRIFGEANVEFDGHPEFFSGPASADVELGMYTIVVDGVSIETKQGMGDEPVASGYRPSGVSL